MNGVISGTGVPVAGDFPRTALGTPIYVNLSTGLAYFINAANAVQGIGGVGGGDMLKTENLSGLANYTTARTNLSLENVNNTSDAAKPVSTATQTALDAKQATLVSGTNIKTINGSSVLGAGNLTVSSAQVLLRTFALMGA